MKRIVSLALAEHGFGFFTMARADGSIAWSEDTVQMLGADAPSEASRLSRYLVSGLRAYALKNLAGGQKNRQRCLVPFRGEVAETVLLPPQGEAGAKGFEGFIFPYPLHEPLGMMRKYFLSSVTGRLRSLLNSVIVAGDVVAAADRETLWEQQRFLALLAQDAREVNAVINRIGEVAGYTPPGARAYEELVSVPELLETLQADLSHLAQEADISLRTAVDPAMPPVRTSRTIMAMTVFLAFHYALGHVKPLGEILLTVGDFDGWTIDFLYGAMDIPTNLAVRPERHNFAPVAVEDWSTGAELQLIDSLLGINGSGLSVGSREDGTGLISMHLPRASSG